MQQSEKGKERRKPFYGNTLATGFVRGSGLRGESEGDRDATRRRVHVREESGKSFIDGHIPEEREGCDWGRASGICTRLQLLRASSAIWRRPNIVPAWIGDNGLSSHTRSDASSAVDVVQNKTNDR